MKSKSWRSSGDPRGRHYCLAREGHLLTMLCRCGRTYKHALTMGPKRRPVPMSEFGAAMLARYWSKDRGGCQSPPCRACVRAYRATGQLPDDPAV